MNTRLSMLLLLCWPLVSHAQNVVTITDADIGPGDQVTWTSDNIYLLDGFVFVEEGATLTIEPGTIIKGKPGTGENASALIITRGARIYAEGTPERPIIFTAEADPLDGSFDASIRGQWGGLIILGRASTNLATGEANIEGIPSTETRARYGCVPGNNTPTPIDDCDDNDNSGVLRYVSIRHGGSNIGADNEINGLTLGAVGRGTTIEYVEVFANEDDGFEFFGGTVNTRYLVAAFCGDDAFDYDEGFRGKGQFWFAIMPPDGGNRAGEHDGGRDPEDGQPFAIPLIYNATYIGSGASSGNADNNVFVFRDNAGGKYYNSIFTDFGNLGIVVEDLEGIAVDSRQRLEQGDLVLAHNLWWSFGAGNNLADIAPQAFVQQHLLANNNFVEDPMLRGISRESNGGLDPRPAPNSPALTRPRAAYPAQDPFFTPVEYLGAFGPDDLWIKGWTKVAQLGILTGLKRNATETSFPVMLYAGSPNPFRSTATVAFSLNQRQHVRLAIYDLLGREVARLVEGVRPAGTYHIPFDGSHLAAGTYLVRLETPSGVQVRTLTRLP
ncbi:T9SS type A sorting domain-containing protein [Rhodothermus profundi]|uniref:Por secretion system C-terminal sorting domain-containing protein n=1 Tax=Rhodothermus profundi TaxID=633813 RepID=A0A1M6TNQ0_9BACT|nr:T9SS type A sorting domain-containing protein [Rhodothermus profundi]SHK58554.1 Por secretion system C-terminal sorting domain-containing protein [Rhodothermus profundi]